VAQPGSDQTALPTRPTTLSISPADLKLNSQWTWNIFDLRYRNAFDFTWITPKVATGLTYEWNPGNSVFGNVGYAWKDTGSGLLGDKINVGFGFRHSF
jgi:hypothetical protein